MQAATMLVTEALHALLQVERQEQDTVIHGTSPKCRPTLLLQAYVPGVTPALLQMQTIVAQSPQLQFQNRHL